MTTNSYIAPRSQAYDFEALVAVPDGELDLARIALAIASDGYHDLDAGACLSQLDALGVRVREHAGPGAVGEQLLHSLRAVLIEEEGFSGNDTAYYDPRNSFLNEVLARRTGIPITLSLLFLEVGWRVGLPLGPVSFPAHFLVSVNLDVARYIDPYNGGVELYDADLIRRLMPMLGNDVATAEDYLPRVIAASTRRDMAKRMLRNLKGIYERQGDLEPLLRVCNRAVALDPGDASALRDRGVALAKLECHRSACEDFSHYLRLAPDAPDAADIQRRIEFSRDTGGRLH